MSIQWLPIFLSAITSGLLSLLISHIYYRITVRSAEAHHLAQMQATATRHTEQTDQMASHHAEQLLVLRTTLLAVEHDSGVAAARDPEGNLIGGVHHEGQFIAAPGVSVSAVADARPPPKSTEEKPK
jgi:hypothetical protein